MKKKLQFIFLVGLGLFASCILFGCSNSSLDDPIDDETTTKINHREETPLAEIIHGETTLLAATIQETTTLQQETIRAAPLLQTIR